MIVAFVKRWSKRDNKTLLSVDTLEVLNANTKHSTKDIKFVDFFWDSKPNPKKNKKLIVDLFKYIPFTI